MFELKDPEGTDSPIITFPGMKPQYERYTSNYSYVVKGYMVVRRHRSSKLRLLYVDRTNAAHQFIQRRLLANPDRN